MATLLILQLLAATRHSDQEPVQGPWSALRDLCDTVGGSSADGHRGLHEDLPKVPGDRVRDARGDSAHLAGTAHDHEDISELSDGEQGGRGEVAHGRTAAHEVAAVDTKGETGAQQEV